MKKVLMFFAVASCTAFAQIEITGSDISNMFAIGNSATIHENHTQSSVDIGSPGAGNSWNFIALQSNFTAELSSVDPSTSPYFTDFPTAEFCTYKQGSQPGSDYKTWSYSTLNGYFDNLGTASTNSAYPGDTIFVVYFPARHTFMNPTTFNTQVSQGFSQTIYVNGVYQNSYSVSLNSIVDAYGTMTLPGGVSYDALRLRETIDIQIIGLVFVNYIFIAKNGAQVNLRPTDSNPPNSGTISADITRYNSPFTTSVEQISGLPENFSLQQNYPNPFNPSTLIEYSIPEQSFVDLKVYDILGNEVATLVNEEQSAGVYRADFTGADLTSGIYFYQLQAGNFVETKKMILIK